ncbi:MAG: hypothetical protein JWN75_152 [Candidatus Saccharibacteria bacterium]|nr:hypothetical protein [Candidatus Saccharibacteria bacterium]
MHIDQKYNTLYHINTLTIGERFHVIWRRAKNAPQMEDRRITKVKNTLIIRDVTDSKFIADEVIKFAKNGCPVICGKANVILDAGMRPAKLILVGELVSKAAESDNELELIASNPISNPLQPQIKTFTFKRVTQPRSASRP